MEIKFTKMHGCGNDYVYIDNYVGNYDISDKNDLAKLISDRHFGVGSDGLIFINPSASADFEMEMYNADGSRAQMCGNGIRCVAKFVYDHGYASGDRFTIESAGSIKTVSISAHDGVAKDITVDMGRPVFKAADIPVISDIDPVIAKDILIDEDIYKVTCVSMGNPHAVVFAGQEGSTTFDLSILNIANIGPLFENHSIFPERVNTEFVCVTDKHHIKMRVWERGAGETLACGTGCCACVAAGVLNGFTDNEVTVSVLGGDLNILWDRTSDHIFMTGPAETVFTGIYNYKENN